MAPAENHEITETNTSITVPAERSAEEPARKSRRDRRLEKKREEKMKPHVRVFNAKISSLCDRFFKYAMATPDVKLREEKMEQLNAEWTAWLTTQKQYWRYDKTKDMFYQRVAQLAVQYKKMKEQSVKEKES